MTDRAEKPPLYSPVRPQRPAEDSPAAPAVEVYPTKLTNPISALESIRRKMENLAQEFDQGHINHAQYNALYDRYTEQRQVIERLMERNAEGSIWKRAVAAGSTAFLRDHFQARLLYYQVFLHENTTPLQTNGTLPNDSKPLMELLGRVWSNPGRPKLGVGRREWLNGQWLILALGEYSLTAACFFLEPSTYQIRLVGDLHQDFERANQRLLQLGGRALDQFVFPQRALTE